jgi:tellurite resistance protein TehA-like permease
MKPLALILSFPAKILNTCSPALFAVAAVLGFTLGRGDDL